MSEFVAMAYKHNPTNAFSVDWYIGKRCNFDCSYCVDYLHDAHSAHVPLEKMKYLVDVVQRAHGPNVLWSICGGEPTIIPHLPEALQYIRQVGARHISITTNFSRRADYFIELFASLDNITASLHFESIPTLEKCEEYVEKILQVEAWRKSQSEKTFILRFMMYPGRFEHIFWMRDQLLASGMSNIEFRQIRPLRGTVNEQMPSRLLDASVNHDELSVSEVHREGVALKQRFTPKPIIQGPTGPQTPITSNADQARIANIHRREEWYSELEKQQLRELHQGEEKRKLRLWFAEGKQYRSEDYHYNRLNFEKKNNFQGWLCWAGVAHMKIAPDGDIFIGSCHVGGRLGNIFELDGTFCLPQEPVRCPKWRCTDNLDLKVPKVKDTEYLPLVKDKLVYGLSR